MFAYVCICLVCGHRFHGSILVNKADLWFYYGGIGDRSVEPANWAQAQNWHSGGAAVIVWGNPQEKGRS